MDQGDETTMEARIPRRDVDTACEICGAVVGQPCDFAKVGGEIRHVLAEMWNAMDRAKQHPPLGDSTA